MSPDAQSARDDLAFLRAIVGDDESMQTRSFGKVYFVSGLIYGGQMILHAVQALGLVPNTPLFSLAIGLGPTVIFIPVLIAITWGSRMNNAGGTVNRAIGAVFGAIGLTNLALIAIIGSVALHERSIQIWLIFPCCVFVLQGTAWLFAFMMRRHTWFVFVAIGWYVSAIAMALSIFSIGWFILFGGLGLWGCMALPGWVMLRNSKPAA